MGFFKKCIHFLLQLGSFHPLTRDDTAQQTLSLTSDPHYSRPVEATKELVYDFRGRPAPTKVVQGFNRSIGCEYPELAAAGWRSCNGPDSRGCWLRQVPAPGQPAWSRFDINTDYEYDWPQGVIREVI